MENLKKIKQEFYTLLAKADIDTFFKIFKAKISKESSLYKETITIEGSYNHYKKEVREGLFLSDHTKIASFLSRLRQIVDELQDSDLASPGDYEEKSSESDINSEQPNDGLAKNSQPNNVLIKLSLIFLLGLLLWSLAVILMNDKYDRKLLGKDCKGGDIYISDSTGVTIDELLEYKKTMSSTLGPTELRAMLATVCLRMSGENSHRKDEVVIQYISEIYIHENNLQSLSDEQFLAFFKQSGISLKNILFISFLYYLIISYLMGKTSIKLGGNNPKMISVALAFSTLLLVSMGIGVIWGFSVNMNTFMMGIVIPIFLGLLGFSGKTIYEYLTTS